MTDFKIGDYVYGDDWCYGRIVDIDSEGYARVEYETFNGGGNTWFEFDELKLAESPVIYSKNEEINSLVTELMYDWKRLVAKAKYCGMDIRFAPNCSNTLDLYFHEDYPNMLLVDKSISCDAEKEITETDWVFAYDHLNFVIADWVRSYGALGAPWVKNILLPLKKRYDLGERTSELYKRIMECE